ncbi:hypothetical protein SIID45300_03255 [Candidatus Magnetaquicoccaceae bacterium FCR-1]|uniref:Prepilin-type N-terminal cleavage/methylation domain-containing protein n=1 Tax=Candidatus Magnetaquiglobus chichijimensis TaxID=3141448 RepID=A0ABQ0CDD5_9PROT
MNRPYAHVSREGGWTLFELMIAVTIIGILASVAIPSMVGYIYEAESNEAVEMAGRISKAVKIFVEQRPNVPAEDIEALIAPGSGKKGNLVPGGAAADQLTSIIPTLTIPTDARFKYEISLDVIEQPFAVHMCIRAVSLYNEQREILYSNEASKLPTWDNNVYRTKFVDTTNALLPGKWCNADGSVATTDQG